MSPLLACPKCDAPLAEHPFNQGRFASCPACAAPVLAEVYPAFFRKATVGETGEPVLVDGEAGCFYHPQKKAVRPCDGCGRFLCALCDCEFNGQHFCPACLETGKSKGRIKNLENERTRYDHIALALAVAPLLIFYFTIVTAPMALFITVRYWSAPRSLIRRHRFWFILAGLVALAEIAGWAALFLGLTAAKFRH